MRNEKRRSIMTRKFVTLEKVGRDLGKIKGMTDLIEEESAALHAAAFVERTRKTAKLSQAALAKRLGVTQARISQIESGQGTQGASIALLERVAKACEGRLELFFAKAGS